MLRGFAGATVKAALFFSKSLANAVHAAGDAGSLESGIFGSADSDKCPLKCRAVIMRHNGKVIPLSADNC